MSMEKASESVSYDLRIVANELLLRAYTEKMSAMPGKQIASQGMSAFGFVARVMLKPLKKSKKENTLELDRGDTRVVALLSSECQLDDSRCHQCQRVLSILRLKTREVESSMFAHLYHFVFTLVRGRKASL